MLSVLDCFFLFLHTGLTLFNLFGWIYKKTRVYNLVLLLMTGFSWFGLGIFYGIGYCPFTDWHWKVLKKMGHEQLPHSYIKYLADRLTGLNVNEDLTDFAVAFCFFAALALSVIFNIRDYRRRHDH